jgi:hypothetical protein
MPFLTGNNILRFVLLIAAVFSTNVTSTQKRGLGVPYYIEWSVFEKISSKPNMYLKSYVSSTVTAMLM